MGCGDWTSARSPIFSRGDFSRVARIYVYRIPDTIGYAILRANESVAQHSIEEMI